LGHAAAVRLQAGSHRQLATRFEENTMKAPSQYSSTLRPRSLALVAAALAISASAHAQQGRQGQEPQRIQQSQQTQLSPWLDVAIVEVKGGRAADFEDRVKELMTARANANMPPTLTAQVVAGQPNVYHFVSPMQNLASNDNPTEPMSPEKMAMWQSRISETTDSVRFFAARTYPEYEIATPQGAPAPTLLFLRRVEIAPGRQADYEAWVDGELMPALRETDVLGHTMSSGFVGDSPQNFYHAIPLENWAALDGQDPLREVMSQAQYDRLIAGLVGIVQEDEITLLRLRNDLAGQQQGGQLQGRASE
jgi:hypothetical protein